MSIQSIHNSINSPRNDISRIQKQISDETKKEGSLSEKVARIHGGFKSNLSPSALQSKLKEIAHLQADIAKVQATKASYQKKLADKTSQLHRYEADLSREQESERKKVQVADRRRQSEQIANQRELTSELESHKRQVEELRGVSFNHPMQGEEMKAYDLFISHANEDKDDFVRPLSEALTKLELNVWYDEMQLKVGDSLRRSIDRGLANSTYGGVSSIGPENWNRAKTTGKTAVSFAID